MPQTDTKSKVTHHLTVAEDLSADPQVKYHLRQARQLLACKHIEPPATVRQD